jgi:hypothetical protein
MYYCGAAGQGPQFNPVLVPFLRHCDLHLINRSDIYLALYPYLARFHQRTALIQI